MKHLKIRIKLFFVYVKWCFNDCVENYQDIKFRYKIETDKEFLEIQKELETL
jgi:hypothetical protein